MTETTSPVPLTLASRVDQVFPTLTPAQIARVAAHGHVRQVQRGEVLVEAGEQVVPFFVVTAGQVEHCPAIRRHRGARGRPCDRGSSPARSTMLSGRRRLVRIRAGERWAK